MILSVKCKSDNEFLSIDPEILCAEMLVMNDDNALHMGTLEFPCGGQLKHPMYMAFAHNSERERVGSFEDNLSSNVRLKSLYVFEN